MNQEDYWKNLVDRVYQDHEVLEGNEKDFYRLSFIYGETMVDGIEAYFERCFNEFEFDINLLQRIGFGQLASEFESARILLFGTEPLSRKIVETTVENLYEKNASKIILEKLDEIYERIIPQLEQLADYRNSFGLKEKLYQEG